MFGLGLEDDLLDGESGTLNFAHHLRVQRCSFGPSAKLLFEKGFLPLLVLDDLFGTFELLVSLTPCSAGSLDLLEQVALHHVAGRSGVERLGQYGQVGRIRRRHDAAGYDHE